MTAQAAVTWAARCRGAVSAPSQKDSSPRSSASRSGGRTPPGGPNDGGRRPKIQTSATTTAGSTAPSSRRTPSLGSISQRAQPGASAHTSGLHCRAKTSQAR
jgi:hypothetical protein